MPTQLHLMKDAPEGTTDGPARVIALHLRRGTRRGGPLTAVEFVTAQVGLGLVGDSHGKRRPGGKRQVVLVDQATLQQLGLAPGQLREQITTTGLPDISRLPAGQRLRVGQVVLESAGECEPCQHIGEALGVADPAQFEQVLRGRRGVLLRVVEVIGAGRLSVGDAVERL